MRNLIRKNILIPWRQVSFWSNNSPFSIYNLLSWYNTSSSLWRSNKEIIRNNCHVILNDFIDLSPLESSGKASKKDPWTITSGSNFELSPLEGWAAADQQDKGRPSKQEESAFVEANKSTTPLPFFPLLSGRCTTMEITSFISDI